MIFEKKKLYTLVKTTETGIKELRKVSMTDDEACERNYELGRLGKNKHWEKLVETKGRKRS